MDRHDTERAGGRIGTREGPEGKSGEGTRLHAPPGIEYSLSGSDY